MARPKGSKDKQPRKPRRPSKPSVPALRAAQAQRDARKESVERHLDSLATMRWCLSMMFDEVAPALKRIHDLAVEASDAKTQLAALRELKGTALDTHSIAKDIAPYEHRRLAGEKPLDQDDTKGPPVLTLPAIEQAV